MGRILLVTSLYHQGLLADREESSDELLNLLLDYHQATLPHYAPLKSHYLLWDNTNSIFKLIVKVYVSVCLFQGSIGSARELAAISLALCTDLPI